VKFLTNRFRSGDTTTDTYMVMDAPTMPITITARAMDFQPEQVIVYRTGGRFRQMEISGPTIGHEGFNTIRRFDRERDVPEWARTYLAEDN